MDAAAGAVEAGDDARAEPLLFQIVALNPARCGGLEHARRDRRARRPERGRIDLAKRALELDRRNTDYLNTLGIAYSEAQQPDQALRLF